MSGNPFKKPKAPDTDELDRKLRAEKRQLRQEKAADRRRGIGGLVDFILTSRRGRQGLMDLSDKTGV